MAESRSDKESSPASPADAPAAEFVAGGAQRHPLALAALVGGAVAATAGAYLGTRALARRNASDDGRPLNSVMETAITASHLASQQALAEPATATEPAVAREPSVASA